MTCSELASSPIKDEAFGFNKYVPMGGTMSQSRSAVLERILQVWAIPEHNDPVENQKEILEYNTSLKLSARDVL